MAKDKEVEWRRIRRLNGEGWVRGVRSAKAGDNSFSPNRTCVCRVDI